MRILVVSSTPWSDDNSFGISFSNIFSGMEKVQFANIYCSAGSPDNALDMVCYQISERMIVNNLRHKSFPCGQVVGNTPKSGIERSEAETKRFNTARKLRWQILFWARDFVWKIGRWKSPQLKAFLDEFKPDIIFQPVYFSSYMNDVAQFAKKYTGAPMVGYVSDDVYTLKQINYSPFYWIDRLWKRKKVKKTINQCEILYVISALQKSEYEKIFKPQCKILTKCAFFPEREIEWTANEEIRLLYAGNLSIGRWASIKLIVKAVQRLRKEGQKISFDVYTPTPIKKSMQRAIRKGEGCLFHKPVSYTEILKLQAAADILVHAEGVSKKSRLAVRHSLSTKIVDYFEMGKCIFAVGKEDVASIKHLIDNDAAVVAQSEKEVYEKLREVCQNTSVIESYAQKAYDCGKRHHRKDEMQKMLAEDLNSVAAGDGKK